MSLDTGESFRSLMDRVMLKPIGRAMANPLSLALMITGIVMLTIIYTYDSDHKFRTFLRILGITTFFLFVNNHVILQDINARQLNPDQQNILRVMERGDRGYVRTMDKVKPGSINGGRENTADSQSDDEDEPRIVLRGSAAPESGSDILEELPDASSLITTRRTA